MARTRQAANRGGPGNRGGRGRGRGRGAGGPEAGNNPPENPEMAAMMTQMFATLMPAMVAQVTAAIGAAGGVGGQGGANEAEANANDEPVGNNEGQGGGAAVLGGDDEGIFVGAVPRRQRAGVRRGCTYKDFKNCGPQEFDGRGGAVKFIQWLEKMESVIDISGCEPDQRVRYVASSFTLDALTWWNTQLQARGREVAQGMTWIAFKELMMRKFCTAVELQRLEHEFWELKMVGAEHAAYTTRFHELARLVPHLVTPETKRIEKYLHGLVPQVRATMAAVHPVTIEEAILRSEAMTDELVQCGVLTRVGGK